MRLMSPLFVLLFLPSLNVWAAPYQSQEDSSDTFQVVSGDTLMLDGQEVHLADIQAPSPAQMCGAGRQAWPCGQVARDHLSQEIGNAPLSCTAIRETREGRAVSECRAANGDNLSEWMVSQGLAVAAANAPESLLRLQDMAQARGTGVWRTATTTRNPAYNDANNGDRDVDDNGAPSASDANPTTQGYSGSDFNPNAVVHEEGSALNPSTEQRPTFRGMACAVLQKGC